jgi:hypothetical protein
LIQTLPYTEVKVKFFLVLKEEHSMLAYETVETELRGWLHTPAAFPSGKEPRYTLNRRTIVPRAGLDVTAKRKSCPAGIQTHIISP